MEGDTLGGRIKSRRRGLDLSQSELGGLAGGMSQAWVSRVEKNQLVPDGGQIEALESVLGSLSADLQPPHAASVETSRGPAVYKAVRLANENTKRRAGLALRMDSLLRKEEATNEMLADERELAVAFIRDFLEQAAGLPADVLLGDLQSVGTDAFDVVDDEAQELIAARNGVVKQLEIQIRAATPTRTSADVMLDGASAYAALTALEAFATSTTGAAIKSVSLSALATATGQRRGSLVAGGRGAALGFKPSVPIMTATASALIAAGLVAMAGRRLVRAQDERSQLLEAGIELDRLQVVIDEYCTQAEAAASLLAHARAFGANELKRLQEDVAAGSDSSLDTLVKVVALILTVLPLPVPDGPSELAPLGAAHRANEIALESAESWLAEAGALD